MQKNIRFLDETTRWRLTIYCIAAFSEKASGNFNCVFFRDHERTIPTHSGMLKAFFKLPLIKKFGYVPCPASQNSGLLDRVAGGRPQGLRARGHVAWQRVGHAKDSGSPTLRWPPEFSQRENFHHGQWQAPAQNILGTFV